MPSINKVVLIGHLGSDPKIINGDGFKIASFSLATSEHWKDKRTGERKEMTDWHRVVVSSPSIVEFMEKYSSKGDLVYLEGKIRNRKYNNANGEEVLTTEIVVPPYAGNIIILSGKKGASQETTPEPQTDDLDDSSIPF